MESRFQRRSFAPIKAGEELDVNIEAVGAKGDGIAKIKGFVIFVPGVKQGETVRVKVTKVFKKVGFAEVLGAAESSGTTEENTESNESESSENTESEEDYSENIDDSESNEVKEDL